MLQPMHTMRNFDMDERRGAKDLKFLHALRKDFNSQLPEMFPMLEQAISDEFGKELSECRVLNSHGKIHRPNHEKHKLSSEGQHQVRIFSMARRVIARANCTACFGAELCIMISPRSAPRTYQ